MGAGSSAQTVQEHLDKQEALIKRLQTAVEKQGAAIDAKFDEGEPAKAEWDGQDLEDEIEGLHQAIMRLQSEANKPDPTVYPEEADCPDAPVEPPTQEAKARKPWLESMYPPSDWKPDPSRDKAPDQQLELEYVYGVPRGRCSRNSVAFRDENTLVYYAGAVGIIHDIDKNQQTFIQGHSSHSEGHSDDILCLSLHEKTKTVATGQRGKGLAASICVWCADTGKIKAKLAGFHVRAVLAVTFNNDGTLLASVGHDEQNSVAVYDWGCGQKVASQPSGRNRVMAARYEPGSATDFVTVGVDHICFWSQAGDRLTAQHAKLGKAGKLQPFLSIGFTGGNTVVGTALGELYLFGASRCLIKAIDAHNGPVACLAELGPNIVTGGKDGYVSIWDGSLRRVKQYDMNKADRDVRGANRVRSLAVHGESIAVSTINSSICKITPKGGVQTVVSAHYGNLSADGQYGELWGLAADPTGDRFATVCDDAVLRLWDIPTHSCVSKVDIAATSAGGSARSLCWSPDGKWLVAGFLQGSFAVFNVTENLLEELRVKKRKRRIQCVQFSPCSKLLAVGSAENTVDIYDANDDFRRICICKGNSSVVMAVDWSADSKLIQTTSQGYELMYFDFANEHKAGSADLLIGPIPADKVKEMTCDVKWATNNSYLNWNVQGIWPSRDFGGGEINAVCRDKAAGTVATADIYGRIKLFRYPAVGSGFDKDGNLVRRPCSRWVAPSATSTNVIFSYDDKHVISTGGSDLSIFQWRVVPASD